MFTGLEPQQPPQELRATTTKTTSAEAVAAAAVTTTTKPSSLEPSYSSDLFKLIDLRNFNFTINQPKCDKSSSLLVILVHSAPKNFLKRNRIRGSWGSLVGNKTVANYKLYFLFGTSSDPYQQRQLALENVMFPDIIQGNFIDDYKNMTYKHVMALKWFRYFCSNTLYLVKTDDDVFVNIKHLVRFLSSLSMSSSSTLSLPSNQSTFEPSVPSISNNNLENFMFCHKLSQVLVKRTHRSKWYVSPKDYKYKYYPEYCPGYIVVYSKDVVDKLYTAAQKMSYFWIDDVHLTGNIRKMLNIPITSFEQYLLKESVLLDIQNNPNKTKELCKYLFAWSNVKPIQVDFLWDTLNTHC